MRMPDCGPFGETLFAARVRAIVAALFLNNPGGGWVESVVTFATQRLRFLFLRVMMAADAAWRLFRTRHAMHARQAGHLAAWQGHPEPRCRPAFSPGLEQAGGAAAICSCCRRRPQ